MPLFSCNLGQQTYRFDDLKAVLTCASPLRSGRIIGSSEGGNYLD